MRNRIIAGVVTGLMAVSLATAAAGAASAAPTATGKLRTLDDGCTFGSTPTTVSQGSAGATVDLLQDCLNLSLNDDNLTEDGKFGPITRSAVIEFQSCDGIGVDGIVGPQTWGALKSVANSPFYCDAGDIG